MAIDNAEVWAEVLREAIAGATAPVVGTNFRTSVIVAASKRGLSFPPETEPDLKFLQLLQRHPDAVSILRRPGQDFLVAPAGRSDMLAEGVKSQSYGIRRDLFQALTMVSQNRPFYDKTTDSVAWRSPSSPSGLEPSLVALPVPTIESETALRHDFAAKSAPTPAAQGKLAAALSGPLPLQAFSASIRELGLQREWHSFRTERLVERLQAVAKDNGLDWNNAWLTASASENLPPRPTPTARLASNSSESVGALLEGLDAADIQRISVPLDLVLKALAAARKR